MLESSIEYIDQENLISVRGVETGQRSLIKDNEEARI